MNTNTQSPATHTPTPWRAVSCTTREGFTIAQAPVNARGEQNVAIAANIAQLGNNSADAAFIIRACNSHAQLVAALKWQTVVLEEYWYAKNDEEKNWAAKDVQHAIDQARAALSAAQK